MATVKAYLKNPYRNGIIRQDEVSILLKFTESRAHRFEIRIGEKVKPEDWNEITQEVRRKHHDQSRINRKIASEKARLLDLRDKNPIPFDQFELIAKGKEVKQSEVAFALRDFIGQYAQEREAESIRVYKYFAKTLEPFLNLTFDQLDWNFFDRWKDSTSNLSNGSRATYLACLKCFLSWCVKRKHKVNMDYKEFRIRKPHPKKLSLSIDEVARLRDTMIVGNAAIGRAYLLFECYTGARISDIERFNPTDLRDGVWIFPRKKGSSIKQREIALDLVGEWCSKALDVLNQYGGKLPKVSRSTLRLQIREACRQAKIESWQKITSHVGRRTFATILTPILGLDEVADMMGIDPATAQKYYKGPSDRTIRRRRLVEAGREISTSIQVRKEEKLKVG